MPLPETFGRYRILRLLGSGGMGSVFKARHLKLDRTVAVKFLTPQVAAQPEVRTRFEREAKAMAMLSHPHIVQVFDFGSEEGEAYLTMEYLSGGPVSKRLPLAPKDAVRVVRQVCDRVIFMDHGQIAEEGIPGEIFTRPQQARTRAFLREILER